MKCSFDSERSDNNNNNNKCNLTGLKTQAISSFFFFFFFLNFLIATRRTLLYKTRQTLLTIPPTRCYLFYLLYNTSLDCNSYPTFYSFFFFFFYRLHTYVSIKL